MIFFGLAQIYGVARNVELTPEGVEELPQDEAFQSDMWFGLAGRYKTIIFNAPEAEILITGDFISFTWAKNITPKISGYLGAISGPSSGSFKGDVDISELQYTHLWHLFKLLSKLIEVVLVFLGDLFVGSWGIAIILLCVLVKLLLLPMNFLVARYETDVAKKQSLMAPVLADIKANYKGEEAHKKLMGAYKDLKISPFYELKPLIGSLIQIPILIAVFNALGEMPQLQGSSFMWINSLAHPDTLFLFPFSIPLMGNGVNLLPLIMTLVTVISTIQYKNKHSPESEMIKKKRNLYFMALGFFILFYPFPAAMVLYWLTANLLQIVQQKLMWHYHDQ